jgi:hypothetical protein
MVSLLLALLLVWVVLMNEKNMEVMRLKKDKEDRFAAQWEAEMESKTKER